MTQYAVLYERGERNWSAYVPDLPGYVATGKTREETERRIREAVSFHIEGLKLDGEPVPEPSVEAWIVAVSARDLAADLLQSIREMKTGEVAVLSSPVIETRKKTGLSQSQFAALLGVSVRTLQGWQQGRKQPSGAARTLLAIARTNPKAVLAIASK
jgi:putative transcriptional regulator